MATVSCSIRTSSIHDIESVCMWCPWRLRRIAWACGIKFLGVFITLLRSKPWLQHITELAGSLISAPIQNLGRASDTRGLLTHFRVSLLSVQPRWQPRTYFFCYQCFVFNDFAVIVLQIQTVHKFLALFLYCPLHLAISACAYFAKKVTILKFNSCFYVV